MIPARHNPFATDRMEHMLAFDPSWANTSWEAIDQQWHLFNQRAAITGRHGAGKTTFLDAWKNRLTANGHEIVSLFLNRDHPSFSAQDWETIKNSSGKIILLDGEEQLDWKDRRAFYQLSKQSAGLLVTRHRKNHLPVLAHLEPDIQILQRCIEKLAPEYHDQLSPHLPKWWKQSKGNTREVLLKCYDVVSQSGSPLLSG